jgi:hypothetical protein
MPGAYRELLGSLPPSARATDEGLQVGARRLLRETLTARLNGMITNYADSADEQLQRRVRLLGTDLTPAIFSLATLYSDDALALWANPKFEALSRVEAAYPDATEPALARQFYANVEQLYAKQFDVELARRTFQICVAFLRWATVAGATDP